MNERAKKPILLGLGFVAGLSVAHFSRPEAAAPPAAVVGRTTERVVTVEKVTSFHWSRVESADYVAYIANLRAIGCPEPTVRDIIIADVGQLFAPRYAALAGSLPEFSWWGRYDPKKPLRAEAVAKLRALDAEKKTLLQRLLGSAAGLDFPALEITASALRERGLFAFLPETKRAAVREIVTRYDALREWGEAQWKGLPTSERDAREKDLFAKRAGELSGVLSAEEQREFDLRHSPVSDRLREQFGRSDITEAEFRRLYELRQEFDARHAEPGPDDWKRLEADTAAAVGGDRLADINRQNDGLWLAMQSIATETGLMPDAMKGAYAVQQEYAAKMVAALGKMFADPQQDPAPVRAIASEMEARLVRILGEEVVKRLDRLGALPRLVVKDDGVRKSYSFSRGGTSD